MDSREYYTQRFDSSGADGARWFDQKVTHGNLFEVADAVNKYVAVNNAEWFTRMQIQESASLNSVMQREYGKPALSNRNAANEYDKFIGQNLNTLAYAGVLESRLSNNRSREYRVLNQEVLNRLTSNEKESRVFLLAYLEWVLKKFNWWTKVEAYVKSSHSKEDMENLKRSFTKLLMDTMGLGSRGSKNPEVEAGRIFQKVINLIAFQYQVPGIRFGRIAPEPPNTFDLNYNRPNWRDSASNKPKKLTRKEYESKLETEAKTYPTPSELTKTMKKVRDYQGGISEIKTTEPVKATHVHHIFPKSQFKTLADMPENLIALTPGQHLGVAHPNGNTSKIDPVFQRECLLRKLDSIKKSVENVDGMYHYENFREVLETGLGFDNLDSSYESLRQALIDYVA